MRHLSKIFLLLSFIYSFGVFTFVAVKLQHKANADTTHIVISQIQLSGEGNAQDEFIELYNPTNVAIEMTEWRLTRKSSTGGSIQNLVSNLTGTIAPRSYYLIAHPSASTASIADKVYSSSSSAMTTNNTISLFSDAGVTLVDKVGLGTAVDVETSAFATNPTANQSIVRKATANSDATSLGLGGLEATFGNGFDTDNNANDFVLFTTAAPRNTQSPQANQPTTSPAPSVNPTATPEPTVSVTVVPTVTSVPTPTPSTSSGPTVTPAPTSTPTAVPTSVPTNTPVPTQAPTATPVPTAVPTVTSTPTVTPMPTATKTPTPTVTSIPTPTAAIPTSVPTATPAPTATPTPKPQPEIIVDRELTHRVRLVCTQSYRTIKIFGHKIEIPRISCKLVRNKHNH